MLFPIPAAAKRRFFLAAAIALLCAGCAASSALHRGDEAERRQEYDLAVVEYTKAVRLKPDDTEARARLNRAKLRASTEHFQRGRRLTATGKYEQALIELELAAELNPTSTDIDDELRATRN
jgi:tetratricopeptide (TPR) repeat protein